MRRSQIETLRWIAAGDVGWRDVPRGDGHYGTTRSYRRWLTESDYEIVTTRVRPLILARLAIGVTGAGLHGRGFVELTHEGRQALATYPSPNAPDLGSGRQVSEG